MCSASAVLRPYRLAHATPLHGSIQVQICAANMPIAQQLLVMPTTAQPDPSLRETTIPIQPIYPN